MAWDILYGMTKSVWDVLSAVANLSGMFCLGCQKWHGMFCPAPKSYKTINLEHFKYI